jgi:hypothetical protein
MPNQGDIRITCEYVRGGQPRPYADTERVVRLTLEHVPYRASFEPIFVEREWEWEPWSDITRSLIEQYARAFCFWKKTQQEHLQADFSGHFDTYLDYLRQIPDTTNVWEIRTVTPFTD